MYGTLTSNLHISIKAMLYIIYNHSSYTSKAHLLPW